MTVLLPFGVAIGLVFVTAAVQNRESIHGNMEFGVVAAPFGENAGRLTHLAAVVAVIGLGVAGSVRR